MKTSPHNPEPYRREVQAHCYRLLGSITEAEDAAQETLLRAWRGRESFRGGDGGSLRRWLYRIATNLCLTALARRRNTRRLTPQIAGPAATRLPDEADSSPLIERLWLDPYPDTLLETVADTEPGPHARYEMREATRLAFIAAIQLLPPRQRATLLLRDVLGWSASETAETLAMSVPAANSALQRARATLAKHPVSPLYSPDPHTAALLERYVQSWERLDLEGFITLLKEDAIFSMPPLPQWYRGQEAIRTLLAWAWPSTGYEAVRLVSLTLNGGQPAFAMYGRTPGDPFWHAHALQTVTAENGCLTEIVHFLDEATLFPKFGLPLVTS